MWKIALSFLTALGIGTADSPAVAQTKADSFEKLSNEFTVRTLPILKAHCLGCHSKSKRKGDLDLERFGTLKAVRRAPKVWKKVSEQIRDGEMPPKGAKQLTAVNRKLLTGWVKRYLRSESFANAGDPGPVVLRRLNNAEYTYTVRDLTGVPLSPAKEFPTDSASGEGFTNTGNSLIMSPGMLRKYLDAGKAIAAHAVLLPSGIRFSSKVTKRDRTDEILAEIRAIYGKHSVTVSLGVGNKVGNVNVHGNTRIGKAGLLPVQAYLLATVKERSNLQSKRKTIRQVAQENGLNPKYLGILWSKLNARDSSLILDDLKRRWRAAQVKDVPALTAFVDGWQRGLFTFGPVGLIGRKGGPQRWMESVSPVVSSQSYRFAIPVAKKGKPPRPFQLSLLASDAGDGNKTDFVVWNRPHLVASGKKAVLLRDVGGATKTVFGKHPNGTTVDSASLCVRAPAAIRVTIPAKFAGWHLVTTAQLDKKTGVEGSVQTAVVAGSPQPASGLTTCGITVKFSQVTHIFSDRRDVQFSNTVIVTQKSQARRTIMAAMRDFRNLFPAALSFTQIVPVDEVLTLALFFREDDTLVRLMLNRQQEARLNRLWEELEFVSQYPLMRESAAELLIEVLAGENPQRKSVLPLLPVYKKDAAKFRLKRVRAESKHLSALLKFAHRAYRRPLRSRESAELIRLYRRLRQRQLSHGDAFRLTLARVFISSPFLYRLEASPSGKRVSAVSDWELASRLSYFLWSSAPDRKLLALAKTGELSKDITLGQQVDRMLKDGRVRRLASEFACQWIHVHQFDVVGDKSEKHFPAFAGLRADMHEESVRFFQHLFQTNGSLLDLLDADHTFVNQRLAKFYGIEGVAGKAWRRVSGLKKYGRGGILGLATTLAKQSGVSRTSPILRGNWVSEVLLGERLPKPPQNVPLLPADETKTNGLTIRQLVSQHSTDPKCASCHKRIDPFGFALEGFDAIGRKRKRDLAGRLIDTSTKLPDGTKIDGLKGLRRYLLTKRRDQFLRQFSRKLLGYALGRELQLSDEPLLERIQRNLKSTGYRFAPVAKAIVFSDQFRKIRGMEEVSKGKPDERD